MVNYVTTVNAEGVRSYGAPHLQCRQNSARVYEVTICARNGCAKPQACLRDVLPPEHRAVVAGKGKCHESMEREWDTGGATSPVEGPV